MVLEEQKTLRAETIRSPDALPVVFRVLPGGGHLVTSGFLFSISSNIFTLYFTLFLSQILSIMLIKVYIVSKENVLHFTYCLDLLFQLEHPVSLNFLYAKMTNHGSFKIHLLSVHMYLGVIFKHVIIANLSQSN